MDNKIKKQNQVHPPKKNQMDTKGNDKKRLWLKDGNTTMLIAEGLTENACKCVIDTLSNVLVSLGKKPINKRCLITR